MKNIFKFATLTAILLYNESFAITLEESIDSALQNNTQIAIEQKKAEIVESSRYEAATGFLPSASLDYIDGQRRTKIGGDISKRDDNRRVFSVKQPLFDGFGSVSKFRETLYNTKSAREELKYEKNNIAYQTVFEFLNVIKFQKLIKIEEDFDNSYKKILKTSIAKLRKKLISYQEYSDYLFKSQKNKIQLEQDKILLADAKLNWKNYTKIDDDLKFDEFKIKEKFRNFDDFLSQVLNSNPQINAKKFSHQASKAASYSHASKLLPKISLNYQEEKQKNSYYLNNQDVTNRSIFLNFSIPLFQGGIEYYSISKAKKEQQIAHLEFRKALEEVEKEARIQFQNFSSLSNYVEILKDSQKTLEKSLKIEEKRFKKRDIDRIEFLSRKIELSEINKEIIDKEHEMMLSYFKMKFLINEIVTLGQKRR